MFLGDSNLILLLFLFLLSTIVIYTNSALHLLLTAELIWITLYALTLLLGFFFDNLNLVSLTFFFLILSAVEFSVGLVLILFQHTLVRTLDFNFDESNTFKYQLNKSSSINSNRLNYKF